MNLRWLLVLSIVLAGCGSYGTPTSSTPTLGTPSAPYSCTDVTIGAGATATQGRSVTVAYNGFLNDPTKPNSEGTRFDSNPNFSFVLGVGGVIRAWDMCVVGMRVGGQRHLVAPPELGYGGVAQGAIPANSTLVFDITLNAVN
jgi:FKBP-type peptidyl-prolyl cis-trans isomerase